MHKSALRSFPQKVQHATSEHGLARHQKMVEAESEHGSMEASEELEIRSRSTEVLMVSRSEALQGQKTRRCYAPSCLTLMIFKYNIQTSDQKKVQVAGYAD